MPRSRRLPVRAAADGITYLNVGSGPHAAPGWTNVDLARAPGVDRHDLRRPLPYEDASFDAVYASHVLEHFDPPGGLRLLREMRRVARPGAPVRIVVPDLERIVRDYVTRLDRQLDAPTPQGERELSWIRLELLDQLTRRRSGGQMLPAIRSGVVDPADVRARTGDELAAIIDAVPSPRSSSPRALLGRAAGAILARWHTPSRTGELHRWMYDRLSLAQAMTAAGIRDPRPVAFDESAIPAWDQHALDASRLGPGPRKPDSLFMEGHA